MRRHPPRRVWGSRVDIKAAYTHVLIKPRDALILATLVTDCHDDLDPMVAIPLMNQWGSQPAMHMKCLGEP